MKFLLGADPEVIILDKNNEAFSSEGLIGYGKEGPLMLSENIGVHEDNILVEWNIAPAKSKMEFINQNIEALYLIYKKYLEPKGLKFSRACYALFAPYYLQTEQAQAVGCSPEFDAATLDMIDPPIFADGKQGRSAGGHVHIGYENENLADSMMMVKMLDLRLAIPSLLLDADTERRQLYGKPSSYRRTEGLKVEYRVLSNFWLFDQQFMSWVYDVVAGVVNDVLNGTIIDEELYLEVREVINTNNRGRAEQIIAENALLMPTEASLDILELITNKDDEFLLEMIGSKSKEIEVIAEDAKSEFELRQQSQAGRKSSYKKGALSEPFFVSQSLEERVFGEPVMLGSKAKFKPSSKPGAPPASRPEVSKYFISGDYGSGGIKIGTGGRNSEEMIKEYTEKMMKEMDDQTPSGSSQAENYKLYTSQPFHPGLQTEPIAPEGHIVQPETGAVHPEPWITLDVDHGFDHDHDEDL